VEIGRKHINFRKSDIVLMEVLVRVMKRGIELRKLEMLGT
jgi:hypothetical protein